MRLSEGAARRANFSLEAAILASKRCAACARIVGDALAA
jgi:hypothetical protein